MGGLVFITDDARGLYETLKERGVTDFTQEPTDHFYGTDMGLRDPFGNPIRILQQGKVGREGDGLTGQPRPSAKRRNVTMTSTSRTPPRSGPTKSSAAMKAGARERKAASRRSPADERAEGEADLLRAIAEMPRADRVMAEADPRARHRRRAGPRPEDLLRHAGLGHGRQERQGHLLLQAQVQVQGPVLDVRVPGRRQP